MVGRLFAVVGPSGVGKDTLMEAVRARSGQVYLVRRVITRPVEAGGEAFISETDAGFDQRVSGGEFALHWGAHGLRYGIPKSEIARAEQGCDVLFNASRSVLGQAVALWPGLTILHVTADPQVLAQRLAQRGRETAEDIEKRLARAGMRIETAAPTIEIDNSGALEDAVDAVLAALAPLKV